MPAHPITRDEFDAYQPLRAPDSERLYEEVEWFADEMGNIIGSIIRDRTDDDWSWVMMGRDVFRAIELDTCLPTPQKLKSDCWQ